MKKVKWLTVFMLLFPLFSYAIKIVHGPYLQNVYETEATIVWETDIPSVGWVEVASADDGEFYSEARPRFYDENIGVRKTSCLHAVRLTGLKACTAYRYRVYGREVKKHEAYESEYGGTVAMDIFHHSAPCFRTLDRNKAKASFMVYNDIHERPNMLEQLGKLVDYKNIDMVIFNGDMMNYFQHDSTYFKGFMDEAVHLFASEKPLYYVRGNHETRGPWAERFHEYTCPRQPNLYFAWQQGPVFFIALDTGEDKPDNDIEYGGFCNYDAYRTEEARWLEGVVQSEAFNKAKYRVVIGHIPPAMSKTSWHGDMEVRNKFVPILNKAGIDLMICGHTHEFSYHPNVDGINFPILINSNHGVVAAEANQTSLNVRIVDIDGKTAFKESYSNGR